MAKRVYEFYPKKELVIGNKYILKEYIAEGTFGYVWSAIHLETEELVALKIPKDQERGDHALSEGIKLIGYSHPNIIKINWMGRLDGVFVIEMELFKGKSLADELDDTGFKNPRTIKEITEIFIDILKGVKFLHSRNICHGDIKPQNILFNEKQIKLTDFGTSKFIENVFVKTVDAGGTWAYMAPEIAGSNKRYLISDIYSLGVLLYQMLTGRTPHETPIQVINNIPFPKPREINDNIPVDLEDIIMKMLRRDPADRYQNVDSLKEDIVQRVLNRKESSESSVVKIIERSSEEDWMQNVINLYQANHYEEAEKLLRHERKSGNNSQDLIHHIAYVCFSQRRYYDSLSEIEKIDLEKVEVIRREGFKDNVYSLKAKVYMELKKYEEAMRLYEYLLKKNPDDINYKYRLAITYGLVNRPNKAIELLEEINEKTPGMLYVVKKLGHAYDMQKEFSKARAYFKYCLRMDPNDEIIKNRLKVYEQYLN
ncbi:MAG: tetratricopeptide repeat protein [Tissierellaceae bacterium]|jgi:serine/threonine protein kinase|uniref:serine/threonine-protein kinase n=1 Tax=Clostridium cochlearium TaxID=1494 RepID=UPI00241C779F|nr:serine/threonine-protein kinase [Clostridium cochlearium]MBE6064003.1 tetratricopeptide repeat protein [Clostridium cochlearium]MBE6082852.1 tetratricopeptide repeat protein [Tissierellaceae bacterium]